VIAVEVLSAKYRILTGDLPNAEILIDFAFGNLRRYFFCGPSFIPVTLPLQLLNEFEWILTNAAHCLFLFGGSFINGRLILFDWLSEIQDTIADRLRSLVDNCADPIEPSLRIRKDSLHQLATGKFPDFFATLGLAKVIHLRESRTIAAQNNTISHHLRLLRANIRLSETQKLLDDEMHNLNRAICRQIESIADACRRQNPSRIPADLHYDVLARTTPTCQGLIFVQHLFGSIYVYRPQSGQLRRVSFIWSKQSFSMLSNRSETTFTTVSGLFTSDFYALVAEFVLADKQRRPMLTASSGLQLCRIAADIVFGKLAADFRARPVMPDDVDFGDRGFFSRSAKGSLASICTSDQPMIFITSADLRALPLEFMFPKHLVLRACNFVQLMLKPNAKLPVVKPVVCRQKVADLESASRRRCEAVEHFLQGCGSGGAFLPYIGPSGRSAPLPFPLFSSARDTGSYRSKYPFCEIVELSQENLLDRVTGLYIFTYADFCEMPKMLQKMIAKYPFAYYMFIPAMHVKEAFTAMVAIFERQQKRVEYAAKEAKADGDVNFFRHCLLTKVPFDFITILQGTLMDALGCPIALVCPAH
jgi:hypothetical protein